MMDPIIELNEQEQQENKWQPGHLKTAVHLFKVHGYLKIERLFPTELIQTLQEETLKTLQFAEEEGVLKNGTQVSHRRYIIPLKLQGPFNAPLLYAHPLLMELFCELLGKHFILSSLGTVTALPGSQDQHVHADYFSLFEEKQDLNGILPPFALTVGVPLIDIDNLNGPTKIWPGSHLTYPIDQRMHAYPQKLLSGDMGSCYFWDYRTFHAGGSNHSEFPRPLLYMAYTRRWFLDALNPDRLEIDPLEAAKIPQEHRSLFAQMPS